MNKRYREEENDEERQQRILDNFKSAGRLPTPKPGHYHDPGDKQRRKKDRKNTRNRLRDLTRGHNQGRDNAEEDF